MPDSVLQQDATNAQEGVKADVKGVNARVQTDAATGVRLLAMGLAVEVAGIHVDETARETVKETAWEDVNNLVREVVNGHA